MISCEHSQENRMNFRQAATSRRSPPVINMTPLIDVVFILLIFFLLTTTFRNAQA